jgi:phage replication-related protein YjqB (UPF0714/DUF867 family)
MNFSGLKMMEMVKRFTHNLVKTLSNKYICKLISIVLAITLFTFVSSIGWSDYAWADTFSCYQDCPNALITSKVCTQENEDYKITPEDKKNDVTVLSIHGGKIEEYTSRISKDLSSRYNWNLYDFNGDIKNKECSKLAPPGSKNKNFAVLHITATEFNEEQAIKLVQSHKKAIAIHGHGRNKDKDNPQTICVGGSNTAQIEKFITNVNKESDKFKSLVGYSLNLVNVPKATGSICIEKPPLDGIDPDNIVNKNKGGSGGLQLELSKTIREDLAKGSDNPASSSPDNYQLFRNVIYNAINCAMVGRRVCPSVLSR